MLQVAVANPTSLARSAEKFNSFSFDICMVSETSATKYVQRTYAAQYKKQGLHLVWGCDVPSQQLRRDATESIRGLALGVALISKPSVTIRPTRQRLPEHWERTCRIMVGYAQLPSMSVRLICVYGVQCSAQGSFQKNLSIWRLILHLCSQSDIPTIVGGDFNLKPQTLNLWEDFVRLGFGEAFEQHEIAHGVLLPPTCKGATRHDTLIYSHHFVKSFSHAEVDGCKAFPSHDPLIVSFRMRMHNFVHRAISMPEPLHGDILTSDIFKHEQDKQVADCVMHSCERTDAILAHKIITNNLQEIGGAFENAYCQTVDVFNMYQGESCSIEKPKVGKFGRLTPKEPHKVKLKQTVKKAREGAYEPKKETFCLRTIQWVKQLRRVEAMCIRAKKYKNEDEMTIRVKNQHEKEWFAILTAPGFSPGFPKWAMKNQGLHVWYCIFPPCDWLYELFQLFRQHVDKRIAEEKKFESRNFQHKLDLDRLHFGSSYTHKIVKAKNTEVIHCFEISDCFDASLVRQPRKDKPCIKVNDVANFHDAIPIQVRGSNHDLNILHKIGHQYLQLDSLEPKVGTHFQVQQKRFSSDPEKVAKAFFEFWCPYWLRDQGPELTSLDSWKDFMEILETCPAIPTPRLDGKHTLDEWKQAIRSTKVETSRGICGFSQPELKAMSNSLLEKLIDVMHSATQHGLPPWVMIAKVVLVPKFPQASLIKDMRPITIFSLIFRTWSKVCARRLLFHWSFHLPPCIVGALPKRSCSQLSLSNAIKIEHQIKIGNPDVGGFYLDICKCFNGFGRLPVITALKQSGFPADQANMWSNSLAGMTRTLDALHSCSILSPATTGLAEGDPLSVCGMVIIGHCWYRFTLCLGICVSIYADDWSWDGTDPQQHILAIKMTEHFLKSLKLVADPSKIWVWGATSKSRKQWEMISIQVVGRPKAYRISMAEKELGVLLHYSRQNTIGHQQDRIDNGIQRLLRLKRLPTSIQDKASIVQTNVWPASLYGTDVTYLGKKHFDRLRTAATDAILTKTKMTNTLLPMAVLHDSLQDPLVYVVLRALNLWRRLLITDFEGANTVMHILGTSSPNPNQAFGPSSALHSYLVHLNWKISSHGLLVDHFGIEFDLRKVDKQFLVTRILDAWDYVVSVSIESRKDFTNWPVPQCNMTFDTNNFDESRKSAIVALHQTLGPQFGEACEKWKGGDQERSNLCPLCKQSDSRPHFIMQCEGVRDIKEKHAKLLTKIEKEFPHMLLLPIVYKHPKHHVVHLAHHMRQLPDPFDTNIDGVDISCGRTFYTDGSCVFPSLSEARLAGFSIVVDLCDNDHDRINQALLVRHNDQFPVTLVPVHAGLQIGQQTINRAEFTAALQVVQSCNSGCIVTDSQWTCDLFQRVQQDSVAWHYHNNANYDLIVLLCFCFNEMGRKAENFCIRKIKAHQRRCEVESNLDLYGVLANDLADQTAKRAVGENVSVMHTLIWEVGRFYQQQRKILRQFLDVLTEIDIRRSEAKDRETKEEVSGLLYAQDSNVSLLRQQFLMWLRTFQQQFWQVSFRVRGFYKHW